MKQTNAITTKQDPESLARLNDIMTQAGQAANEAGAPHAFEDHTARKADNTIRLTKAFEVRLLLAQPLTDRTIDNLLLFRETVALGLANPTDEDKRRWLELLQVGVTVTNQKAVIACRISNQPFTINLHDRGGQYDFKVSPKD